MTTMSKIVELWSRRGCQCSLRHDSCLGGNGNGVAGSARGDRTSSDGTGGLCLVVAALVAIFDEDDR